MLHRVAIIGVAALAGSLVVPVGGVTAGTSGIRVGPIQTVCASVTDAEPGDVALTNVTVIDAHDAGFVTAHNEDINPWAVSSVNFGDGDTVPNLTATVVTGDRRVCVTSSRSTTAHLVVDLVAMLDGDRFTPQTRGGSRILDTREPLDATGGRPVAPLTPVCVAPPRSVDGPAVALVNATVTEPEAAGFVTVRGSKSAGRLVTSTHNFGPGQTVANLTITQLDRDERLCAIPSRWSSAHIIFDLVGWLDADAFQAPQGGPIRLFDTRRASGPTGGQAVAPGAMTCSVVSAGGVAAEAGAMVISNIAVTQPSAAGYATVHASLPGAISTHNFASDQTVANATTVTVDVSRSLCVSVSTHGSAHVVADLAGVIVADAVVALPNGTQRLIDSRERTSLPGRHGESRLRFPGCAPLLERFKEQARQGVFDEPADEPIALPTTNGNDPVSTPEFSTTNTQDAEVDEGDLVETDGRHLYTSVVPDAENSQHTELQIVDIAAGTVAAQVPLPGVYPEMILHDRRLVVTTRGTLDEPWSTQTTVTVFDVTDPSQPTVVDQYGLDGTREAMRSVGGRVRVVLSHYRRPIDAPTAEAQRAQIDASTIEDWMPRVFDVDADGGYGDERQGLECDQLGLPHIDLGSGMTWVVEDDLRGGVTGPEASSGIAASGYNTAVMASRNRLYVASTAFVPWSEDAFLSGSEATGIHMFEMSEDEPIDYAASTDLPGRLLNQFAMGEHDGVLRVAVTAGWWDDGASSVFALRQVGTTFERLSAITNLAVGERIFAVRHIGDTSYVVTFRETDPLFVIDFADPARPVVAGELKIPGFSTYLHPVGPDLLLGVGQDAELTGRTTGAQLSLFDVSNPADPRRIDTLDVGGFQRLEDHREFLFWPATGTIAVPTYDDVTDTWSITVSELDGRRLSRRGRFATGQWQCRPDRTVAVGDELLAVSRSSVTIVDSATLDVRTEISACSSTAGE